MHLQTALDDRPALASARSLHSAEQPRLHMRLAHGARELEEVFRLRYDVFFTEKGAVPSAAQAQEGLDYDAHDAFADHLVVRLGDKLVGTYRLLPLARLNGTALAPYSSGEFSLAALRAHFQDNILELGRSCVHSDFRNGQVPRLLFAGVAGYMLEKKVASMIGCVSVHGATDLDSLVLASSFRAKGLWDARFVAEVNADFAPDADAVSAFQRRSLDSLSIDSVSALIPPLMKGYFNMGALIAGGPASDRPFRCHDFLMNLEVANIKERYFNAFIKPILAQRDVVSLG